ncbi:MAG: adenylate/guanylate cyclase domain-containing protein, partial [Candidatus Micrarchaeota archaeon]|nr:adenylate/guanylate cyclase domain-containing protein [Candidatus Micrarchaeota archaeon]
MMVKTGMAEEEKERKKLKINIDPNRNALIFISSLNAIVILVIFLKLGLFGSWQMMLEDKMYIQRPPFNDIAIVAIDDESIRALGPLPWNRTVYADAVSFLENSSVVGIDLSLFDTTEDDWVLASSISQSKNVVLSSYYSSLDKRDNALVGSNLIAPSYRIMSSNPKIGYSNIIKDQDDAVRKIPEIKGDINSFSEQVALDYLKANFTRPKGDLFINYGSETGRYSTVSFSKLNSTSPSFFKGKIVLIGITDESLNQNYLVPVSRGHLMPRVEIQANAIETMITEDYLIIQDDDSIIISMLAIAILTSIVFILIGKRGFLLTLVPLVLIPVYCLIFWFIAVYASTQGYIFNLFYPPLAIVFASIGVSSGNYFYENLKRNEVMNEFGRYVSPNVVNAIFKGEKKVNLSGVEKEVTIMFSDIRGFTALSEKVSAKDLVELLNSYLGALAEVVFENKGTVDKYMGDAIMAVYNSPFNVHDHEGKACLSALQMQEAIKMINKENKKAHPDFPELYMGIGINTGKAIIGNIGSKDRVEFTSIGDTVNTTARIESLTKYYGTPVLIGENTYNKIKGRFFTRELDSVLVKGKSRSIKIYELRKEDYDHNWDKALELYRKGDFSKAILVFEKLNDAPSKVFIERSRELIRMGIRKSEWNGVFEHTV